MTVNRGVSRRQCITMIAYVARTSTITDYHTLFLAVIRRLTKARSKRRSTHVPNLTDELSTAEERRLNQFGSAG